MRKLRLSPMVVLAGILLSGTAFGQLNKPPLLPGLGNKPVTNPGNPLDQETTVGIKPDLPFGKPGGILGHWGVGNGGDWLRIGFARSRDYAANVVLKIKPISLSHIKDQKLKQWIIDNQKFLAADILQTEHVWSLTEEGSCAWTVMPGADEKIPVSNPIQLSYPTCRAQVDTFLKAAQILIHESVHHFRGDEAFADAVAIAIIDAWQQGLMDSTPINLDGAPGPSSRHAALWTGSHMLVFGGFNDEGQKSLATAYAYDPARNTWANLNPPQGFGSRHDSAVVWANTQAFVWGGFRKNGVSTEWVYDGALVDPVSKTWKLIGKPSWWTPRSSTWDIDHRQTATIAHNKIFIWGGVDSSTNRPLGAIFNLETGEWERMNVDSPYAPMRIAGHSSTWTGSKLIVWGGYEGQNDSARMITNEGGIYDPKDNTWLPTVTDKAPSARAGHQAVWTGQKLVVVSGGGASSRLEISSTGGSYDPETGEWNNFVSELMAERVGHRAAWNGEEILIMGGKSNRLRTYFGELYAYNPLTKRWRTISGSETPPARNNSSIVWTGSSAIVWGGSNSDGKSEKSGAVYYP